MKTYRAISTGLGSIYTGDKLLTRRIVKNWAYFYDAKTGKQLLDCNLTFAEKHFVKESAKPA